MTAPILEVRGLVKRYARGLFRRRETFRLEADLTMRDSSIVGVMGPNGSGKTTLFELITGSNKKRGQGAAPIAALALMALNRIDAPLDIEPEIDSEVEVDVSAGVPGAPTSEHSLRNMLAIIACDGVRCAG